MLADGVVVIFIAAGRAYGLISRVESETQDPRDILSGLYSSERGFGTVELWDLIARELYWVAFVSLIQW